MKKILGIIFGLLLLVGCSNNKETVVEEPWVEPDTITLPKGEVFVTMWHDHMPRIVTITETGVYKVYDYKAGKMTLKKVILERH